MSRIEVEGFQKYPSQPTKGSQARVLKKSEKLALGFEIPHGDFYDVQIVLHLAGRKKAMKRVNDFVLIVCFLTVASAMVEAQTKTIDGEIAFDFNNGYTIGPPTATVTVELDGVVFNEVGNNSAVLSLDGLPSGLYMISVLGESGILHYGKILRR